MSKNAKTKLKLPKAILDMKFMKKSKEKVEKELADSNGYEDLYSNVKITNQTGDALGNFIFEPSYQFCEELIDGRVSYKGMNPEIERLMELEKVTEDDDMAKDVSDEVLAKTFKSLKRINRTSGNDCGPSTKRKKK